MKKYYILLVLLAGITACQSGSDKKDKPLDTPDPVERKELNIPAFNADSAYAYIGEQVSFGPRVPNSEGHQNAKDYLVNKLESYSDKVHVQEFKADRYDGIAMQGYNIIGSFNPASSRRILLLAHWDTRFTADQADSEAARNQPVLGADDGGSGVGVLLEVARQLSLQRPEVGVDIFFTDLEDQGKSNDRDGTSWGIGAQHWAKKPHVNGYTAEYGILLDMVGAKGAQFPKEGVSQNYAPQFQNYVWNLANSMGYGHLFQNKTLSGGVVDDHLFINEIANIPTINIINKPSDQSFGKHWHTEHDTMDNIDKNVLRAVGQVTTAVVYRFDANYL